MESKYDTITVDYSNEHETFSCDAFIIIEVLRKGPIADITPFVHRKNSYEDIEELVVRSLSLQAIRSVASRQGIPPGKLLDEINIDRVAKQLLPIFVKALSGSVIHTCWTECELCKSTNADGDDEEEDEEYEWEDIWLDEERPTFFKPKRSSQQPLQGYINGRYVVASSDPQFKEPLEKTGPGQYLTPRRLSDRPQHRSDTTGRSSNDPGKAVDATAKARNSRFRVQKKKASSAASRSSVRSSIVTRSMARALFPARQRGGSMSRPSMRDERVNDTLKHLKLD